MNGARVAGAMMANVLCVGLLAVPSFPRAVPEPSPDTSVVTVKVGGDRTGPARVGPLAGVELGLFDGPDATKPVDDVWGVCVSDHDGDCSFVIPDARGADEGARYYVKQISAPGGWYANLRLRTGHGSGAYSVATPYAFELPASASGATYTSTRDFVIDDTRGEATASTGVWQQSRVNPRPDLTCGLDVALLLDLSASVGRALPDLKAAADTFTDALTGTPSRMALFTFDRRSPSVGTVNRPELTPVSTEAGAAAFKNRYADWELGSGTNWDRGLWAVAEAAPRYDLLVVLTDGNPTFYDSLLGDGGNTRIAEVEAGIFSANAVKAEGTRVLAVGVGNRVTGLTARNLRAISGTTAFSGSNAADADYFQTRDYAEAGQALRDLARARCRGSLSVIKQIVPANNTGEDVTGAAPAGSGWEFTAETTTPGVGGLPGRESTINDGTGSVNFGLTFNEDTAAEVTVAETRRPGHTLVTQDGQNAVCRDIDAGGDVPVTNGDGFGFTVEVPSDAAISCTVYSRPAPSPAPRPRPTLKPKPKPRPKLCHKERAHREHCRPHPGRQ